MQGEYMKLCLSILCTLCCLYGKSAQAESDNLSAAAADVAGKKICDRLQNRFRGLQSKKENGEKAYSGTLWIHSCEVVYDDSQQDVMTLSLGINGWRWLDREKDVLGANYSTDEFARFEVDVDLTGEVITQYEPQSKRLALWFRPTKSPKVDFKASGDVDIDKESMWGSALAGAATLIGQSPDTIADEKLASKGEQRFTDKIAEGFSAAIDFCSGKVVSELGQPDEKTLLGKLDDEQSSGFKNVDLAPSTFLLFGPYGEQSPALNLVLRQDKSDNFQSKLVCVDDAIKLAKAYMAGNDRTPDVPSIDMVRDDAGNGDISLTGKNQTCPVVALFATDKSVKQHAAFTFKVQDNDGPKPLAVCN